MEINNYDNMYTTECIGGCGNFTNGSQYCQKYYCDKEEEEEEEEEKKVKEEEIKDIVNDMDDKELVYIQIIEILDKYWEKIENSASQKRPKNWFDITLNI